MDMEIIHLSSTKPEVAAKAAVHALSRGNIVLYPTDTIYGLGVNALDSGAITRLRELKGREKRKPISIIVESIAQIEKYAVLTPAGRALAEKHLPGPLTLVLKADKRIPPELQLNGTIGIRIPNDPFCLALAKAYKHPFTSTSANLSGRETLWNPLQVLSQFRDNADKISLVIDAGERNSVLPSTVVLATGDAPFILREGALSREALGIPLHASRQ